MKTLASLLLLVLWTVPSFARPIVAGLADACLTNTLCLGYTAYANAVYESGAVPYVLPASPRKEDVNALLDRIDLLILCGGEDVEPARYGETNHVNLGVVNPRRDAWDIALMDEAVRRKMPILGICRGCQILNVRFGGTLWQDLPSEKPGAKVHCIDGLHDLTLNPGSYLGKLVGGPSTTVNSRHHQAVKVPARGFTVTGTSSDGVIEAIEGTAYPALGVQFHPELMLARIGRREFLPIFRGAFANVDSANRTASPRRRLVAIPECCPRTEKLILSRADTIDALENAGFAAVVIPFTDDDTRLESALADADALMIGKSIDDLQNDRKRYAFENRAIRIALKRGIPIAAAIEPLLTFLGETRR